MSIVILALGFILDIVIILSFFSVLPKRKGTYDVIRWTALVLYAPLCIFAASYFWVLAAMALIFVISYTYEMPWRDRVVWSIVLPLVTAVLEIAVQFFASLPDGYILVYRYSIPYALGLLISKPACYVAIMALRRFAGGRGLKYKPEKRWTLFVMPAVSVVISFIAMFAIDNMDTYPTFGISGVEAIISITIMLLTVANFVVFLGYEHQHNSQAKEYLLSSQKQREESQVEHYTELTERQKTANRAMHDLKNRLYGLREIMGKDPAYARKTIDEIIENVTLSDLMVKTGIESVDALLGSKYMSMKKKEIEFSIKAFCPQNNHIDVMDLCVVIGNLLDNAIEANEKLAGGRYIKMTLNQVGPVLNISVINKLPDKTEETLETTKTDKIFHGFGMSSIRQIAEKYNGGAAFVPGDGAFTAHVTMYNS